MTLLLVGLAMVLGVLFHRGLLSPARFAQIVGGLGLGLAAAAFAAPLSGAPHG